MLNIPGLQYIPDYISLDQHNHYLTIIDQQPWLTDISRRVQHYGYKYSYTYRSVDHSMKLGPLPHWAEQLAKALFNDNLIPRIPDQVIVNEYLPGQGISHHIDCVRCFGKTIASISLAAPCIMDFISSEQEKKHVLLEPRSLLVFSDEARYKWKHGIAKRKTDLINGSRLSRSRRLSITFRNVILSE